MISSLFLKSTTDKKGNPTNFLRGKETVRMDKVNQALAMFGMKAVSGRKDD